MHHQLAIVIPAYKNTFLRETLSSIANQSDKRFMLYIGDDCSPNDVKSIVDEFKDKINLIYHRFDKNLGGTDLVGHWQRCIELTHDEPYIWLFSDDDIMDRRCVEYFNQLPNYIKEDSLCHFDIKLIDSQNNDRLVDLPKFPYKLTAGEFLEAKLRGRLYSFVVEFIFSRNLYHRIGGFKNFDLAWGADFMTWITMISECKNGLITISKSDGLVKWRKSNENISPNHSHDISIRKIKSLIENAMFLKQLMCTSPQSFRPLKKCFRWLRFPLGEIHRKRNILTIKEIYALCGLYKKKVGYPFQCVFFFVYQCLNSGMLKLLRSAIRRAK